MAIFVTGDVHGGAEYGSSRFSSKSWPDGRTLSRDDVVVVAGDFGFVWDGSNTDRYWLDWFESKPWTTCFVDGKGSRGLGGDRRVGTRQAPLVRLLLRRVIWRK